MPAATHRAREPAINLPSVHTELRKFFFIILILFLSKAKLHQIRRKNKAWNYILLIFGSKMLYLAHLCLIMLLMMRQVVIWICQKNVVMLSESIL
jgi:hypothetical protein